jgi:hypothetical protein
MPLVRCFDPATGASGGARLYIPPGAQLPVVYVPVARQVSLGAAAEPIPVREKVSRAEESPDCLAGRRCLPTLSPSALEAARARAARASDRYARELRRRLAAEAEERAKLLAKQELSARRAQIARERSAPPRVPRTYAPGERIPYPARVALGLL